jgi:CRISPR/Cas system CSM-associated protein Csm3 (group 7 of RAMP superfamily)
MGPRTAAGQLWDRVMVAPNGCWLWLGAGGSHGYGQLRWRTAPWLAHRLAYVLTFGPLPDWLEVDHLCRIRSCIRPDHLEPVTPAENTRRMRARLGR